MAFDVKQHANLGYIDRDVKDKLDALCELHRRTLKAELEYMIEQAALELTSINK
jgi:hypothetical protein